jgi:hypothetical protein
VAPDDPIAAETLLARDGEVVHLRIREALGMAAAATAAPAGSASRSGEGRA